MYVFLFFSCECADEHTKKHKHINKRIRHYEQPNSQNDDSQDLTEAERAEIQRQIEEEDEGARNARKGRTQTNGKETYYDDHPLSFYNELIAMQFVFVYFLF